MRRASTQRMHADPSVRPDDDRLQRAERLVTLLQAALHRVSEGVVVCDETGAELFRNRQASELVPSRLDGALVSQAIEDRLGDARLGPTSESALELFAPTRRTLVVRASRLLPSEGAAGAVAIVEDASARQRIDAIRRDFVANVSHELKTPVGALSLLAETLEDEDDPEVISRLSQRVATEAERLGRIIDDLLDLSRIEVNEGLRSEEASVADLVDEALGPLQTLAAARHIIVEVGDIPAHLRLACNRRDLVSAISNLVDNAVKYSEDHGMIRVSARAIDGFVDIAISDRGLGIPQRDMERIFERFYRVDRARSRTTGGTGLGLSIVRHVAANHGGTVDVMSKEGEGSTFTLRLSVVGVPLAHPDRREESCG
ncbi:MAG: ATP-binding protein [Actinomycetota bacterium]|nr:ATP-binding protein [Actinomycetota bacterium]